MTIFFDYFRDNCYTRQPAYCTKDFVKQFKRAIGESPVDFYQFLFFQRFCNITTIFKFRYCTHRNAKWLTRPQSTKSHRGGKHVARSPIMQLMCRGSCDTYHCWNFMAPFVNKDMTSQEVLYRTAHQPQHEMQGTKC